MTAPRKLLLSSRLLSGLSTGWQQRRRFRHSRSFIGRMATPEARLMGGIGENPGATQRRPSKRVLASLTIRWEAQK
jgi:hypothetical protein